MTTLISGLPDRVAAVRARIAAAAARGGRSGDQVRLVAVTKYVPDEHFVAFVQALLELGIHDIGESRVQQLRARHEQLANALPDSKITWHLIGHLQKNKAKYLPGLVDYVHSIDSPELAIELDRRIAASDHLRPIRGLLQVNISGESTKEGLPPEACEQTLQAIKHLNYVRIAGLMTMAPLAEGDPRATCEPVFKRLCELARQIRQELSMNELMELSMGMTNDFEVAVEHGATLVRIGSALIETQ